MRRQLAQALVALARILQGKAAPGGTAARWPGGTIDRFQRVREPTPAELLGELKNVAYTCASLNASACASHAPDLYVTTRKSQPEPKCPTGPVAPGVLDWLRQAHGVTKASRIEEVMRHPLLDLLNQVNPRHNAWDLWELTTLYQESEGNAYWLVEDGPLDRPAALWILPSPCVRPVSEGKSGQPVDYYEYEAGRERHRYAPERIVHFAYPNPRDPYGRGLSPLRAAYEQVRQLHTFNALRGSVFDNAGLPAAVLSPKEVLGEDERIRVQEEVNQQFRRGGGGGIWVGESAFDLNVLSYSLGDLAALAEYGATKEDVCGAFHVPLSYLTKETNLANLEAAERQHMATGIRPRLRRRDSKLNEENGLVRKYDPTGRLFLASEDPVRETREQALRQQEADLKWGVKAVNEVRAERGLPPAVWGHVPWLPLNWKPTTDHVARQEIVTDDLDTEDA